MYPGTPLAGSDSAKLDSVTTTTYDWATHVLNCSINCTPGQGVTGMYFNITTQPPVAPDPSYWFVNHLYNRIHFASSTSSSSCGTETSSTFSVGYAYGFVSGVVYYGRLVSEQFDGFYCRIDDSGINVSGPGALTYTDRKQVWLMRISRFSISMW